MKKKYRLKSWVKWLILILLFIGLLSMLAKTNNDFVKSCINSGYSETYCKSQL